MIELGRAFVAANPPPGRLVVCAVTGSHIYGFPSPDSDIDLKGIHLAPTRRVLSLTPGDDAHDRTGHHDGIECDLTTNEAGPALKLLLAGNGNMLERILSPLQLVTGDELDRLQALDRHHRARWPALDGQLAEPEAATPLPAEAPNRDEVEAWLVATRLADLERPAVSTGA